jgi:hypothetical protein
MISIAALFEKSWLFFEPADPHVIGKIIFTSLIAVFIIWLIQFYLYEWFESISGVVVFKKQLKKSSIDKIGLGESTFSFRPSESSLFETRHEREEVRAPYHCLYIISDKGKFKRICVAPTMWKEIQKGDRIEKSRGDMYSDIRVVGQSESDLSIPEKVKKSSGISLIALKGILLVAGLYFLFKTARGGGWGTFGLMLIFFLISFIVTQIRDRSIVQEGLWEMNALTLVMKFVAIVGMLTALLGMLVILAAGICSVADLGFCPRVVSLIKLLTG